MRTIELDRMELRNFKGVVSADYAFTKDTSIIGGNATGKSTIYEAYLWCLFDKNAAGKSPKVQPLDENNEVKHKLTTSVKLYLAVDGNTMIVERKLEEDWSKPRGSAELVLKGTTSSYAINEVPMSLTQYNAKLNEILPLDRWYNISVVGIIPSMDQKAARAALQAIAPAIDDRELATPFGYVLDSLKSGLVIEEMLALNKKLKSEAKQDLDGIPAALEAQDRLRVNEDFASIEEQLDKANADIQTMQEELESLQKPTVDEAAIKRANELRTELNRLNVEIANREKAANDERNARYKAITDKMSKAQREAQNIELNINAAKKTAEVNQDGIDIYKKDIEKLREQWKEKNAEAYVEPEIDGVCPTCGQPLPTERIEEARKYAYDNWNNAKVAALQSIQREAERIKARIDALAKGNEEATNVQQTNQAMLDDINAEVTSLQQELNNLPSVEDILSADSAYMTAKSESAKLAASILNEAEAQKDTANEERIEELKGLLRMATVRRDQLIKTLAGRDTNKRIDEERARLEEQQRTLADVIAQCEGAEAQIAGFRKARINAVEEGVSSLFTMVHWKMYEQNVTNDGEKEICQAIINGVPYEQQNTATRINAGIDIVNAFARAYEVSAPLFIDNAESVTNPIPANGQRITLAVKEGARLTIE